MNTNQSPSQENNLYKNIFDNTLDALLIANDNGQYVDVNKAACTLTGYSKEELLKLSVFDIIPQENRELVKRTWENFIEKGSLEEDYEIVKKNGKRLITHFKAVANVQEGLHISVLQDITASRQSAKKILEEERYQAFFDATDDMAFIKDEQFRYQMVNEANIKFFGLPEEEIIGKTDFELMPKSAAIGCRETDEKCIKENRIIVSQEKINDRIYETRKFPVPFKDQIGVGGFIHDITARREKEKELQKSQNASINILEDLTREIENRKTVEAQLKGSEAFLNETGEMAKVGGWEINLIDNTVYWTKVTRKIHEVPDDYVPTLDKAIKFFTGVSKMKLENAIKNAIENGESYDLEVEFQTAKGRKLWTRTIGKPVFRDGKCETIYGTFQDITERKKFIDELEKREEDFRTIFENAALGIFRSTPEGKYELVNDTFANILGFKSADEMLNNVNDISELYKNPEDREKIKEVFERQGYVKDYEILANHPSQKNVWISINGTAQLDSDGEVYYEGTIQDITQRKLAEEKLKESRSEISRILENSLDGILLTGPDGSIYSANPAACKMFDRSEEEICKVGRDGVVDLSDPRLSEFLKIRKEKGKARSEVNLLRKDGSKFPAEVTSALFNDKDGNAKSSMIIRDITDRKIAEEALRESELKFRTVLENSDIVMAMTDTDLRYTWIYRPHQDYDKEDIIGKRDDEISNNEGTDKLIKLKEKVLKTKKSQKAEITFPLSDGLITYDFLAQPLFDNSGNLTSIATVAKDITERKKAEKQLYNSEKRFRTLVSTLPDYIWLKNNEGEYLNCNPMFEEFFGHKESEIIGKTDYDFVPKELADFFRAKDKEAMEAGRPVTNEEEVVRASDSKSILLETTKTPMYDEDGSVVGVLGIGHDITKRKQAEQKLAENEAFLSTLLESISVPMFYKDVEGKYKGVNPAFEQFFRMEKDKLIGKTVFDIHPTELAELYAEKDNELYKGGGTQKYEAEITVANGEKRNVIFNKAVFTDSSGEIGGLIGTILDVTEERKAEDKLRESEKKLFEAQRIAKVGSYVWDITSGTWDSSKVLDEIFGIDEKYDRTLEGWLNIVHPDWQEEMQDYVANEVMGKHKRFDKEYQIINQKNKSVEWVHGMGELKLDEKNNPVKLYGSIFNITERKFAELVLKESEEKFKTIFNMSLSMICIADINTATFKVINPAFEQILGYSEDELLSKPFLEFVHPDDKEPTIQVIEKELKAGKHLIHFKNRYRCKDNTYRWIDWSSHPIIERGITYAIGHDITEQIKAEEEININLTKYKTLFDSMPAGITVSDKDGNIIESNLEAEKLLGLSDEEQKKRKISGEEWKIIRTDGSIMPPEEFASVKALTENRKISNVEMGIVKGKDNVTWINVTAVPIPLKGHGVLISYFDITEKKEMELEVRKQKELAETIINNIPIMIGFFSEKGEFQFVNNEWENTLGWNLEENKNPNIMAEYYPDESVRNEVTEFMQNAEPQWMDFVTRTKDGKSINTSWMNVRLSDGRSIGIGQDITERKLHEKALKESEEKFRNIFNNAQVGIFRTRVSDGKLLMANQKFVDIFGYKTIEGACRHLILSKNYVNSEDRDAMIKMIKKVGLLNNHQVAVTNRKGEEIWLEYSLRYNKAENYLEGVCEDITGEKLLQQKYATVVDNFPNGAIFLFNKDLVYTFAGGEMLHVMGYDIEDVIGKKATDIYPSELTEITQNKNKKIFDGEHVYNEVKFRNRIFANWGIPIYENDKIVEGLVYAVDITEQQQKTEFIQTVMDNLPIGIALNNMNDNRATYHNEKFVKTYGWPREDLSSVEQFFKNVFPDKEYRDKVTKQIIADISSGKPNRMYWENLHVTQKDGSKRIVTAQNIPLFEQNTMVSTVIDVTEQSKAEENLKESEERVRAIFEHSLIGILLSDTNGKILEANPVLIKMLGSPSIEATKQINLLKFKPLQKLGFSKKISEAIKTKKVTFGEDNYTSKWGKTIRVRFHFVPIENNGKVETVLGIIEDVTNLRAAEKALRDSEEKYKTLVESAPDAIVIHLEEKLVFVNSAAVKLMEAKNKKQLIGKDISKYIYQDNLEEVKERVKRILQGKEKYYTIEEKYITLKGKVIDVEVTATPIKFDNQQALQVIIRDISGKKRAQEEILIERNRAFSYLESAGIMMLVLDTKGKVTMINSKGAEILGYSKKYIIGKNWFEYFLPEEEVKSVKRLFRKAVRGDLISLQYYQNPIKCRYNKIRLIGWYNTFIKDENGNTKEVICSGEDITETVSLQKELETSHEELKGLTRHLQKIREDERTRLAREIHDDLGQSLTALKLDLTVARGLATENSEIEELILDSLELSDSTIKSVQNLVSELRPSMIDDLGLLPTIEWYSKQFSDRSNINVNYTFDVSENEIENSNKIVIYRIIQEALTNVARHAKAKNVFIKLLRKEKNIVLSIQDDGIGIDNNAKNKYDSHGLTGMQERARSIGAKFEIKKRNKKGTSVKLEIPIKK